MTHSDLHAALINNGVVVLDRPEFHAEEELLLSSSQFLAHTRDKEFSCNEPLKFIITL